MTWLILLAAFVLWVTPQAARGQSYEIPWHTIDCGGGVSSGDGFELEGTVGQHDASDPMIAFGYSLNGGYWLGPTTGHCGTSDYNGDGDFGTDADIEAFFACLGGNCCESCFEGGSDLNADGDFGTDADIEAFFRVLGGSPC